jgi:hypothetical protein
VIAARHATEKTMGRTHQRAESNPTGSPTVYRTDRGSWVVQGWMVTDREALKQMAIPEGETCVEIPDRIIAFFKEGRNRDQ